MQSPPLTSALPQAPKLCRIHHCKARTPCAPFGIKVSQTHASFLAPFLTALSAVTTTEITAAASRNAAPHAPLQPCQKISLRL